MSQKRLLYFMLALLLICCSCSDDEDTSDPVITFILPIENYLVIMPDTIVVEAEVTDDRVITSVIVAIIDENKIPVTEARYYYPGISDFKIESLFELVDRSLESGNYQVLIAASDGENSKNKYREIIVNEIPVKIKNYLAVSGQFDFKSSILRLDPSFETDTAFVFPQRFALSAVRGLWE